MVANGASVLPSSATRSLGRRPLRRRLLGPALALASAFLQRLPDALLHRAAHAAGGVMYRAQPARRALARANLAQVCRYLEARGLVAPDSAAAAAANDDRALERLVRAAFGHYVRTYLEVAILPVYARPSHAGRITADEPALVEDALGVAEDAPPAAGAVEGRPPTRPTIVVALHFGAIEIPALWGARHGLRVTAPMETLLDRELQAYLERSRGASGVEIVPARGAARQLASALAHGEVVAIVGDRLVGGAGGRVELFGRPARLPFGAATLALDSGAQVWLVAARRTGWGRYRAHLERIEVPAEGDRRARLKGFLEAQARAFERAVAEAPEQWWTLFFPIWIEPAAGARR